MQDFRRETRRDGDALGGPPDASRPANPWPRLLAFAAAVIAAVALAAVCTASFLGGATRELRVSRSAIEPGLPRFFPIQSFGADEGGTTYGVYLSVTSAGEAVALLGRHPDTGCWLQWQATARRADTGSGLDVTGLFVDNCGGGAFDRLGIALEDGASRNLHWFPLALDGEQFVIDLSRLVLGDCRAEGAERCSRDGAPEERRVPSQGLPGDAVAATRSPAPS